MIDVNLKRVLMTPFYARWLALAFKLAPSFVIRITGRFGHRELVAISSEKQL